MTTAVARRVQAFRQRQAAEMPTELYSKAVAYVGSQGLNTAAYLLERDASFLKSDGKKAIDAIGSLRRTSLKLERRIWLPANWKVVKRQSPKGGTPTYDVVKHTRVRVPTSVFGWRLWAIFVGWFVTFMNCNFYLLVSLLHGPLSLRALFSCNVYYPDKTVNTYGRVQCVRVEAVRVVMAVCLGCRADTRERSSATTTLAYIR